MGNINCNSFQTDMTKKVRLKNYRLIYLVKVTIFLIWLYSFINNSWNVYKFEFSLGNFVISYACLSLVSFLFEGVMLGFFTRYHKEKLTNKIIFKIAFFLPLIIFLADEHLLTLSFYSLSNFLLAIFLGLGLLSLIQFYAFTSFFQTKYVARKGSSASGNIITKPPRIRGKKTIMLRQI